MSKLANFRDNLQHVLSSERGLKGQVARSIDTNRTYISSILSGRREPGLAIAIRIAEAIGFSIDELIMLPSQFRKLAECRHTELEETHAAHKPQRRQASANSRLRSKKTITPA